MATESLIARLGLDARTFTAGISKAVGDVRRFSVAGIGISAVALAIKKTSDAANDLAGSAENLGVKVEFLQKFLATAAQNGSNAELAFKNLAALSTKVGEALSGQKGAVSTFAELGVSFRDASGNARPMESILFEIQERISQLPSSYDRARVAQELFGKGSIRLVGVLSKSSEEFKRIVDAQSAATAQQVADAGKLRGILDSVSHDLRTFAIKSVSALTYSGEFIGRYFSNITNKKSATRFNPLASLIATGNQLAVRENIQSKEAEATAQIEKRLAAESKITGQKNAQLDLITQLGRAERDNARALEALTLTREDRAKFTLEELAAGNVNARGRIGYEQRIARQIQELERFAEQNRLNRFNDLAFQQLNRADELRSGLTNLRSNERFPLGKLEEEAAETSDAMRELLRKATEEGIKIIPRNSR